jgi:hypothetical protein
MPGFPLIRTVAHCFRTISSVVVDLVRLALLAAHSRRALAAENLFIRKQLALFQERKVKPRRANDSTRWVMATLSRMFPWRGALVNVQRIHSSVGIAKDSGCSGVGNRSRRVLI